MALSFFSDVVASLEFLETAGERAPADSLHAHPAIANAVREGRRAASAQTRTTARRRGQALPLLVAIVARLEAVEADCPEHEVCEAGQDPLADADHAELRAQRVLRRPIRGDQRSANHSSPGTGTSR